MVSLREGVRHACFRLMSDVDAGVIVTCVSPGYVCPRTYITRDICFPNIYP